MKSECYKNKYHDTLPQCPETDVDYAWLKVGNLTDTWTWCAIHRQVFHAATEHDKVQP